MTDIVARISRAMVRRAAESVGVPVTGARWLGGTWTTHTLRHRCGTAAYAATHNIRAVQDLLGHVKIETIVLYTAIDSADVRMAVDAAS